MKLKNLNGWQRLWVVASLLWLVALVTMLFAFGNERVIPTTSWLEAQLELDQARLQRVWVSATIKAARQASGISEQTSNAQIRREYQDLSDVEFVERVHTKYPSVDFEPADSAYQRRLDGLHARHQEKLENLIPTLATNIGLFLLMWISPSVGVYLLAWGGRHVVLWVWRGFKLKGESQ